MAYGVWRMAWSQNVSSAGAAWRAVGSGCSDNSDNSDKSDTSDSGERTREKCQERLPETSLLKHRFGGEQWDSHGRGASDARGSAHVSDGNDKSDTRGSGEEREKKVQREATWDFTSKTSICRKTVGHVGVGPAMRAVAVMSVITVIKVIRVIVEREREKSAKRGCLGLHF